MNQIIALRIGLFVACLAAGLQLPLSCGGTAVPPPTTANQVELCAQTMALSPDVQAQAAQVGREPVEFTRQICGAVVLAAQVVQANLPKAVSAAAGAASVPISQSAAGASQ